MLMEKNKHYVENFKLNTLLEKMHDISEKSLNKFSYNDAHKMFLTRMTTLPKYEIRWESFKQICCLCSVVVLSLKPVIKGWMHEWMIEGRIILHF